jgi:hypothetical protein
MISAAGLIPTLPAAQSRLTSLSATIQIAATPSQEGSAAQGGAAWHLAAFGAAVDARLGYVTIRTVREERRASALARGPKRG